MFSLAKAMPMKRTLFTLLSLCLAVAVQAQIQVYKTKIAKSTVYPFEIATSDGTLDVLSNGDGGGMLAILGERYQYASGQGMKKDKFGFREKHKRYLVNRQNERLLTYYHKEGKFMFPDGNWLHRHTTETGWVIEDLHGNAVVWLDLISDANTWDFELTTMREDENTETLVKFLAITMPMWAWHEDSRLQDELGLGTFGRIMDLIDTFSGW